MNQTANYQLNQWQKQDRILMSDFNADNLKLDAALAGLSSKMTWETVRDIVTEEDASQIIVDLSDVELTRYAAMLLSLDHNSAGVLFIVSAGKINDSTGYCSGAFLRGTEKPSYLALLSKSYPQRMLLLTGGTDDSQLYTLSQYNLDLLIGSCRLPCSQITRLTLSGNGTAPAGLHLKLVGVKL